MPHDALQSSSLFVNTLRNCSTTTMTALQLSINNCTCYAHTAIMYTLFSQHFCPSLASVSTKVNIAQYPNPVEVGKNVTLTCNVTAERKIEDLKWTDSDRRELRQTDKGVVDLPQPTLRELSASSVLKLSVKDKNGDEWPKNVTCKVELEPENKESHPEIYEIYDETVVVNVTGKSLVVSVK